MRVLIYGGYSLVGKALDCGSKVMSSSLISHPKLLTEDKLMNLRKCVIPTEKRNVLSNHAKMMLFIVRY